MISPQPSGLRVFPYRPRLKPNLLALALFGAFAMLANHEAETNTRGVLIQHMIPLSPSQARTAFGVLTAVCALLAALAGVNVYRSRRSRGRIALGPDYLILPGSLTSPAERRVQLGEIAQLRVREVSGQRFAELRLRSGEKRTIAAGMLPGNAEFEEILSFVIRDRSPGP